MDHKKRNSILRTSKEDDVTTACGVRLSRRISFSEKKSVRVFAKEELAKEWENSYELSDRGDSSNNSKSACSSEIRINSTSTLCTTNEFIDKSNQDSLIIEQSLGITLSEYELQNIKQGKTVKTMDEKNSNVKIVADKLYCPKTTINTTTNQITNEFQNKTPAIPTHVPAHTRSTPAAVNLACFDENSNKENISPESCEIFEVEKTKKGSKEDESSTNMDSDTSDEIRLKNTKSPKIIVRHTCTTSALNQKHKPEEKMEISRNEISENVSGICPIGLSPSFIMSNSMDGFSSPLVPSYMLPRSSKKIDFQQLNEDIANGRLKLFSNNEKVSSAQGNKSPFQLERKNRMDITIQETQNFDDCIEIENNHTVDTHMDVESTSYSKGAIPKKQMEDRTSYRELNIESTYMDCPEDPVHCPLVESKDKENINIANGASTARMQDEMNCNLINKTEKMIIGEETQDLQINLASSSNVLKRRTIIFEDEVIEAEYQHHQIDSTKFANETVRDFIDIKNTEDVGSISKPNCENELSFSEEGECFIPETQPMEDTLQSPKLKIEDSKQQIKKWNENNKTAYSNESLNLTNKTYDQRNKQKTVKSNATVNIEPLQNMDTQIMNQDPKENRFQSRHAEYFERNDTIKTKDCTIHEQYCNSLVEKFVPIYSDYKNSNILNDVNRFTEADHPHKHRALSAEVKTNHLQMTRTRLFDNSDALINSMDEHVKEGFHKGSELSNFDKQLTNKTTHTISKTNYRNTINEINNTKEAKILYNQPSATTDKEEPNKQKEINQRRTRLFDNSDAMITSMDEHDQDGFRKDSEIPNFDQQLNNKTTHTVSKTNYRNTINEINKTKEAEILYNQPSEITDKEEPNMQKGIYQRRTRLFDNSDAMITSMDEHVQDGFRKDSEIPNFDQQLNNKTTHTVSKTNYRNTINEINKTKEAEILYNQPSEITDKEEPNMQKGIYQRRTRLFDNSDAMITSMDEHVQEEFQKDSDVPNFEKQLTNKTTHTVSKTNNKNTINEVNKTKESEVFYNQPSATTNKEKIDMPNGIIQRRTCLSNNSDALIASSEEQNQESFREVSEIPNFKNQSINKETHIFNKTNSRQTVYDVKKVEESEIPYNLPSYNDKIKTNSKLRRTRLFDNSSALITSIDELDHEELQKIPNFKNAHRKTVVFSSTVGTIEIESTPFNPIKTNFRGRLSAFSPATPHRSVLEFERLEEEARQGDENDDQMQDDENGSQNTFVNELFKDTSTYVSVNQKRTTSNLTPNLPKSKKRQSSYCTTRLFENSNSISNQMDEHNFNVNNSKRQEHDEDVRMDGDNLNVDNSKWQEREEDVPMDGNSLNVDKSKWQERAKDIPVDGDNLNVVNSKWQDRSSKQDLKCSTDKKEGNITERAEQMNMNKSLTINHIQTINEPITPSCKGTMRSLIPIYTGSEKKKSLNHISLASIKSPDISLQTIPMTRFIDGKENPCTQENVIIPSEFHLSKEQIQRKSIFEFEDKPITISDVSEHYLSQMQRQTITASRTSCEIENKNDKLVKSIYDIIDSDDIDKTKLELVETYLEETEDYEDLDEVKHQKNYNNIENICQSFQCQNKTEEDINAIQNQPCSLDVGKTKRNSLFCRKCKSCQNTFLNETTSTESNETFVMPTLPSIDEMTEKWCRKVEKYRKGPTLEMAAKLYERLKLKNFMESLDTSADEEFVEKDTNKNTFLKECIIRSERIDKEYYEQVSQLSKSVTTIKSFVSRLKELLSNKRTENWIMNAEMMHRQILRFRHKKIYTFCIILQYEKEDPFGDNVVITHISLEDSSVARRIWTPFASMIHFQLKLDLPFNLHSYCAGNSETDVYEMLLKVDEICDNVLQISKELWRIINEKEGSLIRENGQTVIQKVMCKINYNENGLYQCTKKTDFRIEVTDIKKMCFKDIIMPPVYMFREDIENLPAGLDFLHVFLKNPVNFLRNPII